MRLTLRTLLAYLDNTLEPEQAELIRVKLTESGFATQLVQRIRAALANPQLSAPPPDSVNPISEANLMSEYLDSTLSPEQIAEIERACLESDPHLAESAACHQILTMVLGRPAEVSDDLRARIYETGSIRTDGKSASMNFSALNMPVTGSTDVPPSVAGAEGSAEGMDQDAIPTLDMPPAGNYASDATTHPPVQPVGAGDSGVFDAVTRMHQTEAMAAGEGKNGQAIAGSRNRDQIERSDLYSDSAKPARYMPWLVSLGLAGVSLFAIVQIFDPLFQGDKVADNTSGEERISESVGIPASVPEPSEDESLDSADDTSPMVPAADTTITAEPTSAADLTPPSDVGKVADPTGTETERSESTSPTEAANESPVTPSPAEKPAGDATAAPSASDPAPAEEPMVAAAPKPPESDTTVADNPASDDAPPMGLDLASDDSATPPAMASLESPKPPAGDAAPNGQPVEETEPVGKLLTSNTLVVVPAEDEADEWVQLPAESVIAIDQTVWCAPEFRCSIAADAGYRLELIGPTNIQWTGESADNATLNLLSGRLLLQSSDDGLVVPINVAGESFSITMPMADTKIGIQVGFARKPGADPLVPENHKRFVTVLSVNNEFQITGDAGDMIVPVGSKWVAPESEPPIIVAMNPPPSWLDPEIEQPGSLDAEAREALLELLRDRPLMVALREALSFRRSEVGALAAKTLLRLGAPDVYFGGDGIFAQPKQRTYWESHFQAVLSMVDQSVESAETVKNAIVRMDAAESNTLFQLLTGFSQAELVEGDDLQLVDWLDATSMPVRVLAIENLRRITGTTLYFRAEEDNAVRRVSAIKKWATRQRKGDIRWAAQ